jgi:uncharacterized protein (DUF433 family)
MSDDDPIWMSRTEEDKAAIRAGSLSDDVRKVQRWGLPTHWREAGPFDWTGCDDVVVMPGRLSGVPTVGHSRFSADNLLALVEGGEQVSELVEDYGLDREVAERILRFAEGKKHARAA